MRKDVEPSARREIVFGALILCQKERKKPVYFSRWFDRVVIYWTRFRVVRLITRIRACDNFYDYLILLTSLSLVLHSSRITETRSFSRPESAPWRRTLSQGQVAAPQRGNSLRSFSVTSLSLFVVLTKIYRLPNSSLPYTYTFFSFFLFTFIFRALL